MKNKWILLIGCIVGLFLVVFLSDETMDKNVENKAPTIIKHEVLQKSNLANIKLSLDVKIFKQAEKEELQALALKLKGDSYQDYDRIFISYFLPGMHLNAGAWATSHFNPDLEVSFTRITVEANNDLYRSGL